MAGMTSVPSLDELGEVTCAIVHTCMSIGFLPVTRELNLFSSIVESSGTTAAFQAVELLELEAWHE